ncbi:MAG: hypothetical protein SGJ19_28105, partial [Planctomycetia bacterium]|nr:hypothetical protein [Planctomycetia bacterium]
MASPNQIIITFNENVLIQADHLTVSSAVSGSTYSFVGGTFNYDDNVKTATWTFNTAFPADQLVLTLDDAVTDRYGNALDGEWANPAALSSASSDTWPSGNEVAGGDFIFRVTILPGDVNRDNVVNITDLNTTVNNSGLTPAIWTQGEMTGDNLVNLADKNLVSNNFARNFTTWPGGGMMMMS